MGADKTGEPSSELTEVENELYDRQIRLWGLESQKRIRSANVLISGLSGVGAEVTKNIILSGVHSVKLHDDDLVEEEDFCSQFLVSRDSKGFNRAVESLARAKQLNPMVKISADNKSLATKDEDYISQFDVVVVIGAQQTELIRIDNICRAKNIKFFSGDVWGLFGYCCAELQNHSFVEDVLKHKVISGANEKLRTELITSTVKREMNFPSLDDVFNFNYNSPAYLKTIKRSGPAFIVMHILYKFRETFGRDPSYLSREEDILELETIRDKMIDKSIVPSSWFMNVFSEISPTAAIVGGVLAQEIIKVISKKEAPIQNIFLFDPENCCGFIQHIGSGSC